MTNSVTLRCSNEEIYLNRVLALYEKAKIYRVKSGVALAGSFLCAFAVTHDFQNNLLLKPDDFELFEFFQKCLDGLPGGCFVNVESLAHRASQIVIGYDLSRFNLLPQGCARAIETVIEKRVEVQQHGCFVFKRSEHCR